MTTHEWVHPTPRVRPGGRVISEGDSFDPTTRELRRWPDRIEPLASGDEDTASTECVSGVNSERADALTAVGIKTIGDLRMASVEDLAAAGFTGELAADILAAVHDESEKLNRDMPMPDSELTDRDGPADVSMTVDVETADAVAALDDVRHAADETREAVEALEDSLRSLSKTTGNPQKDLEESVIGGLFGDE